MKAVITLLGAIFLFILIVWWLSERAHIRRETQAMRQLKEAIRYLKERNNGPF